MYHDDDDDDNNNNDDDEDVHRFSYYPFRNSENNKKN